MLLKICVYDIETSPLLAWIFSLGKQRISYGQLHDEYNQYRILSISYKFLLLNTETGKFSRTKTKTLYYNLSKGSDKELIREFDKVIQEADYIIGKNSNKFDAKMVNARRFSNGLPPGPEWKSYSGDLEQQLRRFFRFPSFALDYVAKTELGSGKIKMELQDWIDIVYRKDIAKLHKMGRYNAKDVDDTADLIIKSWPHVKYNLNVAAHTNKSLACVRCGNDNLKKDGVRIQATGSFQRYRCKNCGSVSQVRIGSVTKMR